MPSSNYGHYTHAIVGGIPASLPRLALRIEDTGEVDLDAARKAHEKYTDALRSTGITVVNLQAEEDTPDCVFVEDPVVVANGKAFITRSGAVSRRIEAKRMKEFIVQKGLELQIIDNCVAPATMDGGDVLFTGKEFFIGLSKRTNKEGVAALAAAFPECPVHGITVDAGLHLKTISSVVNENVILIGQNEASVSAKRQIAAAAKYPITFVDVPDDLAANVLVSNGALVYVTDFPKSAAIIEESFKDMRLIPVSNKELAKVDGSLTCCSVLIDINAKPPSV